MGISAPRLRQSRHGVFVFRYLVPPEFQEKLGKKELRRSLKTKNSDLARLIALNLNLAIERAIRYLSPTLAMEEIDRLLAAVAAAGTHSWTLKTKNLEFSTDGTKQDSKDLAYQLTAGDLRVLVDKEIQAGSAAYVVPAGGSTGAEHASPFNMARPENPMRIDQAIKDFIAGKAHDDDECSDEVDISDAPKVSVDRKATLTIFRKFIGKKCSPRLTVDSFMHELQTKDILDFLSYYASRPANRLKKDNSQSSATEHGEGSLNRQSRARLRVKVENNTLAASTLKKQVTNISALIDYCRTCGAFLPSSSVIANQFKQDLGARVKKLTKKNQDSISYKAFNHDDLKKLFEADMLFWCSGGQVDYIWCTLLALHMGFRTKEMATLKLKSIVQVNEIDCIELFLDTTKNRNSARVVPIPQRILDLGFLDYVGFIEEKVSSLPDEQQAEYPLWPHVNINSSSYLADPSKNISRFFSCYRRMKYFELDLNHKVFHSFRHTVVSVLDANNVDVKYQEMIVGHAEGDRAETDLTAKWGDRVKSMAHAMNKRYTSDVNGFAARTQTQRSKQHLDEAAALYELDYDGLKLAVKTAQDLLICHDAAAQKWHSGFRRNQKKIVDKLPPELIPKDMNKIQDFTWSRLKA